MFVFYLFIFIFGLAAGSFLNVVIFRLKSGDEISNDRSKCMNCGHNLAWYDLIPIASFLFLRGKCRYCKKNISIQYPIVELATGILFILAFNHIALFAEKYNLQEAGFVFFALLFLLFFIISALIIVFVYDLKYYIIPNKVIYPAIAAAGIFALARDFAGVGSIEKYYLQFKIFDSIFLENLFAAFLAGLFFLAIAVFTSGRGMGIGDVKLGFLMGFFLGTVKVISAVFLSFVFGAAAGIFLIFLGKKKMKSKIPFGPFLVLGTFLSLFFMKEILNWYFDIFIL